MSWICARRRSASASWVSRLSASSLHMLLAREEPVERGERDLARRVEREHLAVGRDRVLGLPSFSLVDLGHLRVERLALGGVVTSSMRRR